MKSSGEDRIGWNAWLAIAPMFLVLLAVTAAAEVVSYKGSVELKPERRELSADIRMTVVAHDVALPGMSFYINKGLHIDSFECAACSSHSFDLSGNDTFQFMIDSAPLKVTFTHPLAQGEKALIRLKYSGKIAQDAPANMFTPEWTELTLYDGWYPMDPDAHGYTYDMTVKLPSDYKVAGNATVDGKDGEWHMQQETPSNDMVIAASRDLKSRAVKRGRLQVHIDYVDLDGTTLDQIASDVRTILDLYTGWYGESTSDTLELLINPRKVGGCYARTGFISFYSVWIKSDYPGSQAGWAHEIGHFWWNAAPVTSWEDWLNESFAEYSSWRYVRATRGQRAFDELLAAQRKQSTGKPPIWGLKRESNDAHDVLYSKAPLCLNELENMLGSAKFEAFAATLHRKNIKNTAALLDLLEEQSSPEVRRRFESLLKQ